MQRIRTMGGGAFLSFRQISAQMKALIIALNLPEIGILSRNGNDASSQILLSMTARVSPTFEGGSLLLLGHFLLLAITDSFFILDDHRMSRIHDQVQLFIRN